MRKILFAVLMCMAFVGCNSHEKEISEAIKSQLYQPDTFVLYSCDLIEDDGVMFKEYMVNYGYKDRLDIPQREEIEVVIKDGEIWKIDGVLLDDYKKRLKINQILENW